MMSLGFSSYSVGDDGDEESAIVEASEAALRERYSRSQSHETVTNDDDDNDDGALGLSDTPSRTDQSAVLLSADALPPPPPRTSHLGHVSTPTRKRTTPDDSLLSNSFQTTRRPPPLPTTVNAAGLSETSSSKRRRRRDVAEHSDFAPPPVVTKGAYRLQASDEDMDEIHRSLETLGIADRNDQHTILELARRSAEKPGTLSVAVPPKARPSYELTIEQMYGQPNMCPLCEETTTFVDQGAKRRAVAQAALSNPNLTLQQRRKEANKLALRAQADLTDGDQRCHEVIYKIESNLRVLIADERIFRLIQVIRQALVEKHLDFYKIPHVKWTMAMIRTHYSPASHHFYQPLRQTKFELDMAETQVVRAFDATYQGGSYDFRGFRAFKDMVACAQSSRDKVDAYLNLTQTSTADAIRVLASAIYKLTTNDNAVRLLQDPETAAGRPPTGGDNRTSAGVSAVHDPHSTYARSHISAQ